MLVVETVARIRREHFVKGKTIKEIARDLGVSRNTVRRVLRSGETSFEYERTVQPWPKLGRWTAELDEPLESNAAKPAREQLTLIRIFEEFRGRGYVGGYDALRRYSRRWAKQHGEATAAATPSWSGEPAPAKPTWRSPSPEAALNRVVADLRGEHGTDMGVHLRERCRKFNWSRDSVRGGRGRRRRDWHQRNLSTSHRRGVDAG
jgi:transposase